MEKNPNCSWLPTEILEIIIEKLEVVEDYFRFGAVCRDWRSTYNARKRCRRFPPLLLIAPPPSAEGEVDRQQRAIYSPSTNKVYDKCPLQVPHNKVCRGCSFGWLITIEKRNPQAQTWDDCLIQLQNPFLDRTIDLPPMDNIVEQHPGDDNGFKFYYVWKAALSSDPFSSPGDFVVAAIVSIFHGLAFFSPRNSAWISIGDKKWQKNKFGYSDVIFSRKMNHFYALSWTGAVSALDFSVDDPKVTEVALPLPTEQWGDTPNLAEDSSGDLFLGYRNFCVHPFFGGKEVPHYYLGPYNVECPESFTVVFDLFKLNPDSREWNKIYSIGDNVMFVGPNDPAILPSSDCPGCEPNCIYYTDNADISYGHIYRCHGPPYDGVYSLEGHDVRPHYESALSTQTLPQVVWIQLYN